MEKLPALDGQTSERLWYRKLSLSDIEAWMEFHRSPEAIKHLGYSLNDRVICEEIFTKQLERYERDNSGLRAVLLQGSKEVIGLCGLLSQTVNKLPELEIGYHFLPRHWGNGYATEAAMRTKEFTFMEHNCSSIISLIHPANSPSQAVAKRNGMIQSGLAEWRGQPAEIWRVHRADDLA